MHLKLKYGTLIRTAYIRPQTAYVRSQMFFSIFGKMNGPPNDKQLETFIQYSFVILFHICNRFFCLLFNNSQSFELNGDKFENCNSHGDTHNADFKRQKLSSFGIHLHRRYGDFKSNHFCA